MMHCPYCKSPAHAKSSRYMSEQVKERYHQCTNLDCSCAIQNQREYYQSDNRAAAARNLRGSAPAATSAPVPDDGPLRKRLPPLT